MNDTVKLNVYGGKMMIRYLLKGETKITFNVICETINLRPSWNNSKKDSLHKDTKSSTK